MKNVHIKSTVLLILLVMTYKLHSQTSNQNIPVLTSADSAWNTLPKYPKSVGTSMDEVNKALWVTYFRDAELYRKEYRRAGLQFWKNYPNDPRRYKWFLNTAWESSPAYWKNLDSGAYCYATCYIEHASDHNYEDQNKIPKDENAQQEWIKIYPIMRKEFWNSTSVTDKERMDIKGREIYSLKGDILLSGMENNTSIIKRKQLELQEEILKFANTYYKLYRNNIHSWYKSVDFIRDILNLYKKYGFSLSNSEGFFRPLTKSVDPLLNQIALGYINLIALQNKPMQLQYAAIDGQKIDIRKLRGKVVLLDFWSTGCTSCIENMPSIKEIYDKYHEQGFEVISICVNPKEDIELVKKIEKDNALIWPLLLIGGDHNLKTPDNLTGSTMAGLAKEIWKKYGFTAVPQLLLLDKKGYLQAYGNELSYKGLEPWVNKLLELQ